MLYPNIEAERARKALTKNQLCEMLGICDTTLRHWISGKRPIPADKLLKLANYFDCSVDYLLGRTVRKEVI